MAAERAHHRLAGLDLLRIFAALSVLVFHLAFLAADDAGKALHRIAGERASYPELTSYSWWGWVGVEIFFVISGFVIANSAAHSTASRFLKGRVLRLWPGVIICATVTLLVLTLTHYRSLAVLGPGYLRSLLFSPWGPWIDQVYWTLGVEVAFYGLVFLLLLAGRFRWLEPLMAVAALVGTTWFALGFLRGDQGMLQLLQLRNAQLLGLPYGMYFALGVYLWLGFNDRWTWWRLAVIAVALVGGVLQIFATLTVGEVVPPASIAFVPALVWILAIGALVLFVSYDASIAAWFGSRGLAVTQTFGLATYPLYLVHSYVGATLLGALLDAGLERFSALGISLAAMIVLALVVTLWLEPPLRAGLIGFGRLFRRRRQTPA